MKAISYTKGGFYLMVSQFISLFSSFGLQVFLGIILGPALYGVYGVVISVISVSTFFLISGVANSVSRYISGEPELAYTIKRFAIRIQLLISSVIVLFYLFSAPFLAELLNDKSLVILIQIAALALIPRSLAAVYGMYFNGLHSFKNHAISWSIYSLSKLILSVIFAFFYSVFGAIIGFVIAPCVSFLYGFFASKTKEKIIRKFPVKKLIKFSFFVAIFFFLLSLFQTLDLFMVKALLKNNVFTGYYNAAITLSKLPFMIIGTITLILFPAIAKHAKKRNIKEIKYIINQSMRYVLILLFPIVLLGSSKATEIMKIVYTSKYSSAGPVFSILILGLGIFTIFYILGNIVLASGKPHISAAIVFLALVVDFFLLRFFIGKYGIIGAALGTFFASSFVTLIALIYVYKKFGTIIKIKSFLKISFSAAIVYIVSFLIPDGLIFTVLGVGALFLFYGILLWMLKEITMEDINRFKSIFVKKD